MIPTKEQLQGDWISECTQPTHLQDLGCVIKFRFDELPFDNYNVARVTSTFEGKETTLYTGEFEIEPSVNDEFFIIIKDTRIPARQFSENSFIVDVEKYGVMILTRDRQ